MNKHQLSIKQNVIKGKASEHYFIYECLSRGIKISTPLQEDSKYDFLLDYNNNIVRVQLKSCFKARKDIVKKGIYRSIYYRYFMRLCSNNRKNYTAKEVDFIICFIEPTKIYYILPIKIAHKISSFTINSTNEKNSKYDKYKNAWHLLSER